MGPASLPGVIVASDPSDSPGRVACVVWSGNWVEMKGEVGRVQIDKTVPPMPTMLRHRQMASVMITQDVSTRRVVSFIFLNQEGSDKGQNEGYQARKSVDIGCLRVALVYGLLVLQL